MKIFISIPITGIPLDHVIVKADAAAMRLERKGHEVINPITLCQDISDNDGKCLGRCIETIRNDADAVLFLDGWTESKGCSVEFTTTEVYGIQRYFNTDAVPYAEVDNMEL